MPTWWWWTWATTPTARMIPTLYRKPHPPALPVRAPVSWTPTGATLIDADAAAYIAAIKGDGETVTAAQRAGFNSFFSAKRSASWGPKIKRLPFPIWGAAAPNARCMVSLTTSTFFGGVDHNSGGWVQGNGSTGYCELDSSWTTLGLSAFATVGVLVVEDPGTSTADYVGMLFGTNRFLLNDSSTVIGGCAGNTGISQITPSGSWSGLVMLTRESTTLMRLSRRGGSGYATLGTSTTADSTTMPNLKPRFAGGANNNGSLLVSTGPAKQGAFLVAEALTTTEEQDFSNALNTPWETCTGLSLPS